MDPDNDGQVLCTWCWCGNTKEILYVSSNGISFVYTAERCTSEIDNLQMRGAFWRAFDDENRYPRGKVTLVVHQRHPASTYSALRLLSEFQELPVEAAVHANEENLRAKWRSSKYSESFQERTRLTRRSGSEPDSKEFNVSCLIVQASFILGVSQINNCGWFGSVGCCNWQ